MFYEQHPGDKPAFRAICEWFVLCRLILVYQGADRSDLQRHLGASSTCETFARSSLPSLGQSSVHIPPKLKSALWHSLLDSSIFIFIIHHAGSCSLRLRNCAVCSVYSCFQLLTQAYLCRHPQARCSRLAGFPVWVIHRGRHWRDGVSNLSTESQLVAIIITESYVVWCTQLL